MALMQGLISIGTGSFGKDKVTKENTTWLPGKKSVSLKTRAVWG
jgi:hypothetical protein